MSTFGDDLLSALPELRAMAESRMRGTCTIRRPIPGEEVDDPTLPGRTIPVYEDEPVYVGKCYLRYPGLAHEQNPVFAGVTTTISRVILRVPFGPILRPGDVVTIDSDPDNPQLVGTMFRVGSLDDQSQATAQRAILDDFQQGGGVA